MRTIRVTIPGATYHLISRFVDQHWYLKGDEERARYLGLLGRALSDSDWTCISYGLMSSHVHLGMVAGEAPLESWAKRAHTGFAAWINVRNDRIGPVFVRGPKDHAVPPNRIGALIAYIHNNPVRANVVDSPDRSTWTSHLSYLGRAPVPRWLDVDRGMSLGEFKDREAFDAWVKSNPEDPSRLELRGVRRTASRRGQFEFGTPTNDDGRLITPIVRRPWTAQRIDPRWVVRVTAALLTVDESDLSSRSRHPSIVAGRRIATHAGLALGISGYDIGVALGLSKSAVSKIKLQKLDGDLVEGQRRVIEKVLQLTGNSTLSPNGDNISHR